MNRDYLTMSGDPARMRMAAFGAISATQDDPAMQVKGLAVALICTCTALHIDMRQLIVSMERLKEDLDGPFAGTIRAIEEYAKQELG